MSFEILIIDDEDLFREEMAEILREHGYRCETASNGKAGLELALKVRPDLVLCDIIMPSMNGIEVLKRLGHLLPETKVVMITANGTLETSITALREGACDYILKPIDFEDLLHKLERIAERKVLIEEIKGLRREISRDLGVLDLVGNSEKFQKIHQIIETVVGTKTTILIRGETGTGKELVARAVHDRTSPPGKRFLTVNCAAIPANLLEAELFGYMRGAFTGATRDKPGSLELAKGGTVFLDEIGDMPIELQAKLLRAIEEKTVQRLGSVKQIGIDTRFLTATNRDLEQMVKEGKFREDLYYRIRVLEVTIPPLRERREDIPLLFEHFVRRFNSEMKRQVQGVENSAMQALMLYDWPGNVRELKNAVERAMLFQRQGFIGLEHLPVEISGSGPPATSPERLDLACKAYEKAHIQAILIQVKGNRAEAARRLGIDRSTLYRKLSE